jgi:hypothetical protein
VLDREACPRRAVSGWLAEEFAATASCEVAMPVLPGAILPVDGGFPALVRQPGEQNGEKGGLPDAAAGETGPENGRWAERDNRSALHRCSRPGAKLASDNNSASAKFETSGLSTVAADSDNSTPHATANESACRTLNQNGSTVNAVARLRKAARGIVSCVSSDVDHPSPQATGEPVTGRTLHSEPAARHGFTSVAAGVAINEHVSRSHACGDAVHAAKLTLQNDPPVLAPSLHGKKLPQGLFAFVCPDRKLGDITSGKPRQPLRDDASKVDTAAAATDHVVAGRQQEGHCSFARSGKCRLGPPDRFEKIVRPAAQKSSGGHGGLATAAKPGNLPRRYCDLPWPDRCHPRHANRQHAMARLGSDL